MLLHTELNTELIHKWKQFIEKHPERNIFQDYEFYCFLNNSKEYSPGIIICEENEEVVGCLVWYTNVIKRFIKRNIIIGGPLIAGNNPEFLKQLLLKYSKNVGRKVLYTEIRNQFLMDEKFVKTFVDHNFIWEDHLNIHIDLQDNDSFKRISKNKKRNLTKSLNKGVIYSEIKSLEKFKQATILISESYKRINLPCPDQIFFINAYEKLAPTGILRSFIAEYENCIIGVRLELVYNNTVFDWYAGDDKNHSNKYPNDGIILNLLDVFKNEGYKTFDFGGAGKPNIAYGVRDYKLNFGGTLLNPGRFNNSSYRVLFGLFKILLKIRKKFF